VYCSSTFVTEGDGKDVIEKAVARGDDWAWGPVQMTDYLCLLRRVAGAAFGMISLVEKRFHRRNERGYHKHSDQGTTPDDLRMTPVMRFDFQ